MSPKFSRSRPERYYSKTLRGLLLVSPGPSMMGHGCSIPDGPRLCCCWVDAEVEARWWGCGKEAASRMGWTRLPPSSQQLSVENGCTGTSRRDQCTVKYLTPLAPGGTLGLSTALRPSIISSTTALQKTRLDCRSQGPSQSGLACLYPPVYNTAIPVVLHLLNLVQTSRRSRWTGTWHASLTVRRSYASAYVYLLMGLLAAMTSTSHVRLFILSRRSPSKVVSPRLRSAFVKSRRTDSTGNLRLARCGWIAQGMTAALRSLCIGLQGAPEADLTKIAAIS